MGSAGGSRISETNAGLYRAVDEILHSYAIPSVSLALRGRARSIKPNVPEVFRLLLDQGNEEAIAHHLGRVATERMRMKPNRIRDLAAARAAVNWRELMAAQSPVSLPDA
jgi:hypothetical protein